MIAAAAALIACAHPTIVDGDTLRCGRARIRLVGIDAPEFHCPRQRRCVSGDPLQSKRSLATATRRGPVAFRPIAVDQYGRTIAAVYAGPLNLSCWQLAQRQAAYVARWDDGSVVARECGRTFAPLAQRGRPR